jgi:DBP10CT (NUC160) domain
MLVLLLILRLLFSFFSGVSKLESAYLDLQPDNALDLNKKRRLLRWDAKKRKFVKQSLEEMSNVKGLKRLRTESGAPIKQSKIPQVTYTFTSISVLFR